MAGKAVKKKARKLVKGKPKASAPKWLFGDVVDGRVDITGIHIRGSLFEDPTDFVKQNPNLEVNGVKAIKTMRSLRARARRIRPSGGKNSRSKAAKVALMDEAADFVVALEKASGETLNHTVRGIARLVSPKKPTPLCDMVTPASDFLKEHKLMDPSIKRTGRKVRTSHVPLLKMEGDWKKVIVGNPEAPFVHLPAKKYPKSVVGHPDIARLVALIDYIGNVTPMKEHPHLSELNVTTGKLTNVHYFADKLSTVISQLSGKKPSIYFSIKKHEERGEEFYRKGLTLKLASQTLTSLLREELGYTGSFPAKVHKEILENPEFRLNALQLIFDSRAIIHPPPPDGTMRLDFSLPSRRHLKRVSQMLKKDNVPHSIRSNKTPTGTIHMMQVSKTALVRLFDLIKPESPANIAELAIVLSTGKKYNDYPVIMRELDKLMKKGVVQKECGWLVPHIQRVMPKFKSRKYPKVDEKDLPTYCLIPENGITERELRNKLGVTKRAAQCRLNLLLKRGWVTHKEEREPHYKAIRHRYFKKLPKKVL